MTKTNLLLLTAVVALHVDVMSWLSALVLLGWVMTFSLIDVRRQKTHKTTFTVPVQTEGVLVWVISLLVAITATRVMGLASIPMLEGFALAMTLVYRWSGSLLLLFTWCAGHVLHAFNPALTLAVAVLANSLFKQLINYQKSKENRGR